MLAVPMDAKASTTSSSPAHPASPTPTRASTARTSTADARAFAIEAARLFADDKCDDIVVLDVTGLSQVTDFIVIGSGTSERQMRGVLKDVEEMGQQRGFSVFRSSTDDRASWLLADFVDVVAHVFEPNTRAHYDLEMLWGDAPRLEWERPEGRSRDRAGLRSSRKAD